MVYFQEEGKVWPQVTLRESMSCRVGAENKFRKKFFKSISYKNVTLNEIYLYCYLKRNDSVFIDTITMAMRDR